MVLGFLPTSRAISTHPGSSPASEAPCWGSSGARGQVAFSLSAPALPAVWMVLPSPAPCLWGPFVCLFCCFFFIYIKAPGPISTRPRHPTPHHPRTAVNLSVVKNAAALLPASASAVSPIKRGGPSVPLTQLILWEDSGMDRQVETAWAPGCRTPGPWTLPQAPL